MQNLMKNVEVARIYDVSEVTVLNWIKNREKNGLECGVDSDNNKIKIIDKATNHYILRTLCERGRKFLNKTKKPKSQSPFEMPCKYKLGDTLIWQRNDRFEVFVVTSITISGAKGMPGVLVYEYNNHYCLDDELSYFDGDWEFLISKYRKLTAKK